MPRRSGFRGAGLFRDLAGRGPADIGLCGGRPHLSGRSGISLELAQAFVASAARAATSLDLQTADRAALACSCAPTGLVAMGNLPRLERPLGTDPPWLLATAPGNRAYIRAATSVMSQKFV